MAVNIHTERNTQIRSNTSKSILRSRLYRNNFKTQQAPIPPLLHQFLELRLEALK